MKNKNLIDLYNLRRRYIKEGYVPEMIDEISEAIKEKESSLMVEDVSATGGLSSFGASPVSLGVSVPGMGPISSSQPSAFPGSTTGTNYAAGGGSMGSGDISFPMNMGPKGVYSKVPARNSFGKTKEHGGMAAKRNRRKKDIDLKSLQKMLSKRPGASSPSETREKSARVMNFDNFAKTQFKSVTKVRESKTNEGVLAGLVTIALGAWAALKLLGWLAKLSLDKINRDIIRGLLAATKINSMAKLAGKDGGEALTVTDYDDRYYVIMKGPFSKIPNFRIFKEDKILMLNAEKETPIKIRLTDSEYSQFISIITPKL